MSKFEIGFVWVENKRNHRGWTQQLNNREDYLNGYKGSNEFYLKLLKEYKKSLGKDYKVYDIEVCRFDENGIFIDNYVINTL